MTRKLSLVEFTNKKLSFDEFNEIILLYYYPWLKDNKDAIEDELKLREFIITEIKDNYGQTGTIVFSINGSPPKGNAIFLLNHFSEKEKEIQGNIILIGNGKVSRIYNNITIYNYKNNDDCLLK